MFMYRWRLRREMQVGDWLGGPRRGRLLAGHAHWMRCFSASLPARLSSALLLSCCLLKVKCLNDVPLYCRQKFTPSCASTLPSAPCVLLPQNILYCQTAVLQAEVHSIMREYLPLGSSDAETAALGETLLPCSPGGGGGGRKAHSGGGGGGRGGTLQPLYEGAEADVEGGGGGDREALSPRTPAPTRCEA